MDDKPFFEFNLLNFQDRHIEQLKKFTKPAFHLEDILTTASELKYTAAIGKLIAQEFDKPSDNFVRYFATQVSSGRMTQPVRDQFSDITKRALTRYLNDRINELLTTAMKGPATAEKPTNEQEPIEEKDGEQSDPKKQITTTAEEIEGLFAVKSILRGAIDVKRVQMRATKSYCGILLDDNNRKPICRLHFNRTQKYLGIFDQEKNETRHPIESVDDIYSFSDQLKATASQYTS